MAQPTKIPLKMKVSQVKIPLKMKAVVNLNDSKLVYDDFNDLEIFNQMPNYSQLFYAAKLESNEEGELLTKHLDLITEFELIKISKHYEKYNEIICHCKNKCSCDDEWDPDTRLSEKCSLYREHLIPKLYPLQAVSLGLKTKWNHVFDELFDMWSDYDNWNEKVTSDQVCTFIKGLPTNCPNCQSKSWMKSTYCDDTSIVCCKCENDVTSLTNLFDYKLPKKMRSITTDQ